MAITNTKVNQIFKDLDKYRDFCRFNGKVFNEAALYNRKDINWQAFERFAAYQSRASR